MKQVSFNFTSVAAMTKVSASSLAIFKGLNFLVWGFPCIISSYIKLIKEYRERTYKAVLAELIKLLGLFSLHHRIKYLSQPSANLIHDKVTIFSSPTADYPKLVHEEEIFELLPSQLFN